MNAAHSPVICPYCNKAAALVSGKTIYPSRLDLTKQKYFLCADCDAYVGCHREGTWYWVDGVKHFSAGDTPLGRLADSRLRAAKMRAHSAFDPMWQENGPTRRQAYGWLAVMLGIPAEACHIGMFDLDQCNLAVSAAETFWKFKADQTPKET